MDARKLIVRTADQTRRADIDVDDGTTGAALIQAAVDNWSLPSDVDYTLVNTTTGAVVVVVGVLVLVFLLLQIAPVDPVELMLGESARPGDRAAGGGACRAARAAAAGHDALSLARAVDL